MAASTPKTCPVCKDKGPFADHLPCFNGVQLMRIADALEELVETAHAGPSCARCMHPVAMHGPEHNGCSVKDFQTGLYCACNKGAE